MRKFENVVNNEESNVFYRAGYIIGSESFIHDCYFEGKIDYDTLQILLAFHKEMTDKATKEIFK